MRRRLSVDDEEESSDRRALFIRRRLSETETLPCTAVSQDQPLAAGPSIAVARQSNLSNTRTPARFALPQSQLLIENDGRSVQSNLTADENMHPTYTISQLLSLLQVDLRLSSLMPTIMSVREMQPGIPISHLQHIIEENRPALIFNLVDHSVNEPSQIQTVIETVAVSNTPDLIFTESLLRRPALLEPQVVTVTTQASEISNIIQNDTTLTNSELDFDICDMILNIEMPVVIRPTQTELQFPALCTSITSFMETPPRYTLSTMQASSEPDLVIPNSQRSLRPTLEIIPPNISRNMLSVTQPESSLSTSTLNATSNDTPQQIPTSSVNPSSAAPSTTNTVRNRLYGPEYNPAYREYWLARDIDLFENRSLMQSSHIGVAVSVSVSHSGSESDSDADVDIIVREMNSDDNSADSGSVESDESFTYTNTDLYIYGVRPVDVVFILSSDDSN